MTEEQKQLLLEALRSGGGSRADRATRALLESALAKTRLAPEQAAIFDLLFSLQRADGGSATAPNGDEDDVEEPGSHDLEGMRRELADLREANDTVAAALGACPFCWGGDRECHACRGRGRAGHRAPDPKLFAELVVPAVARMRAVKRPARPIRATRPHVDPSTTRKERT